MRFGAIADCDGQTTDTVGGYRSVDTPLQIRHKISSGSGLGPFGLNDLESTAAMIADWLTDSLRWSALSGPRQPRNRPHPAVRLLTGWRKRPRKTGFSFVWFRSCIRLFSCIVSACIFYYCDMVRWAWLDWELSGWLTTLLQCFDTAGWVIRPVKHRLRNDLNCVEWDVKPYSINSFVYMLVLLLYGTCMIVYDFV